MVVFVRACVIYGAVHYVCPYDAMALGLSARMFVCLVALAKSQVLTNIINICCVVRVYVCIYIYIYIYM